MTSTFVFVQIHDEPAVNLLSSLREIFKGRQSKSPIHITVRGPHKHVPSQNRLGRLWDQLDGEGLLIHGIGTFDFPEKSIVYIKSNSKAIRKIWWKRDYPIIRFGFNPHISLFEGTKENALEVAEFLKSQKIELYCRDLSLTLYQTFSDDLFDSPSNTLIHRSSRIKGDVLVEPYRWKDGAVERARLLARALNL
ncbi:hypothetical protein [Rhodoferax sp.]|uniref:hypothetical protein n=1 Tax=Rhodoferax sp. TaxID=50421 RepID=UPI00273307AA|nr:hypothetical protein [Rhodoferax sp.]MDP3190276.1 hypothetical protein [Rhodoferax sp.]